MLKKRVIPTLLFKNSVLVKGKNFLSDRPVISAIEAIINYNFREVDELIFYDILATKDNNSPDFTLISDISKECFVPLVVGGGIKDLKTIEKLLRVGADKVSINSFGVLNPGFLEEASNEFGAQCIIGSLDYKKSFDSKVLINCGTVNTEKDIFEMAKIFEQSGCGEIIIGSIDNDGIQDGYDLETIKKVKKLIKTPIISSGGCGSYEDMFQVFNQVDIDAVAAASIFHFSKMTPKEAKKYLKEKNINVRI